MKLMDRRYQGLNDPDRVVASVRDLIANGTLRAGKRITQRWLLTRLGVTFPVLRQALSKLEGDGALKRFHGMGFYVPVFTRDEVEEYYQIAASLEGLAARLCAARATRHDIAELAEVSASLLLAVHAGSSDDAWEFDVAFHSLMANFCGSKILKERLERHLFLRARVMVQPGDSPPDAPVNGWANSLNAIVTALVRQNQEAADSAMRLHMVGDMLHTLRSMDRDE